MEDKNVEIRFIPFVQLVINEKTKMQPNVAVIILHKFMQPDFTDFSKKSISFQCIDINSLRGASRMKINKNAILNILTCSIDILILYSVFCILLFFESLIMKLQIKILIYLLKNTCNIL